MVNGILAHSYGGYLSDIARHLHTIVVSGLTKGTVSNHITRVTYPFNCSFGMRRNRERVDD